MKTDQVEVVKEGGKIPDVTFRTIQDGKWVDLKSDEIFKGKTVIVFSLPGAYTPTCSSTHVPGYNELAGVLKENGVDEIVCISVNDTFVMNEWQKDQCAENITFLPDGNGEFTQKMGQLVDKTDLGFGKRSWRYSMLVKDGVVEKMFVEPHKPGDPFEVSDAETMLSYINEKASKPKKIALFTKKGCPFCETAKNLLKSKGAHFEEIELGGKISTTALFAVSGALTVPQVFIDGERIGGSEELEKYFKTNNN